MIYDMNDIQLIETAEGLHYSQWDEVGKLIDQATSQETIDKLYEIKIKLFRLEEFKSGSL